MVGGHDGVYIYESGYFNVKLKSSPNAVILGCFKESYQNIKK